MPLTVALDIEGDSSSATQALGDTADGLDKIAEKLHAAADAAGKNNEAVDAAAKSQGVAAKAANDNASKLAQLASAAADLTGKLTGSASAATNATSKAAEMAAKFGAMGAAGGPIGAVAAALGIAGTAATLFFSLVQNDAAKADAALKQHEFLLGRLREAYSGAGDGAAKFLRESKALLTNLANASLDDNLERLNNAVGQFAARATMGTILPGNISPGDIGNPQEAQAVKAAYDALAASAAHGRADVAGFRDAINDVSVAAKGSNPELYKWTLGILEDSKALEGLQFKVQQSESSVRVYAGTANDADKATVGLAKSTNDAATEYERFLKATERRADAMRIEADAFGMTTIAAARYRTEQELNAAAQRAGIELDDKKIEKQMQIAAMVGNATGRLEGQRITADVRSPTETLNVEMKKLGELLLTNAISWDVYERAALKANHNALVATQQQASGVLQAQMATGQAGVAFLSALGAKSKVAAVAAIALNKALAIAGVIQNTPVAQSRSLAELGPIAGPPAAAAIGAWGAAQVALIAATGLVEGGQALSSGSAPAVGGGGGGGAAAGSGGDGNGSAAASSSPAQEPQVITMRIDTGGKRFLLSDDHVRDLFEQFNDAMANGARLHVDVV